MAQVGVFVNATENPQSTVVPYNTSNAFIVGIADNGPTTPVQCSSLAQVASTFGTPSGSGLPYSSRTTTCGVLFDALETYFREGGQGAYVARVEGASPVNATLALAPSAALTLTAQYAGPGGNGIYAAVVNTGGTSYVITLTDSSGNTLAVSPSFTTLPPAVAWAATTGLVTAVSSGSTLPSNLAATPLAGGSNGSTPVLANWTAALAQFGASLGPGQVLAPGVTNTTLSGIWSALGTHALNNNRVAICDMDDNASAATAIAALGTFGTTTVGGYCGFWSGNRLIPGIVPGTSRVIAPSPVIAGLCSQVDATGNPNRAPMGVKFPLQFATQSASFVTGSTDTYSLQDLYTLNGAGINVFATRQGVPVNYGFVASVLPSTDAIYWQFNHARLRMAIIAQSQVTGEPYVGSQMDGQATAAVAYGAALTSELQGFYAQGALYGASAAAAFSVDTTSDVNTPATIAAGQLNAAIEFHESPFAQTININLNAIPITQSL